MIGGLNKEQLQRYLRNIMLPEIGKKASKNYSNQKCSASVPEVWVPQSSSTLPPPE
jgi:hypothetical protein